jgi:hypothetical protein
MVVKAWQGPAGWTRQGKVGKVGKAGQGPAVWTRQSTVRRVGKARKGPCRADKLGKGWQGSPTGRTSKGKVGKGWQGRARSCRSRQGMQSREGIARQGNVL